MTEEAAAPSSQKLKLSAGNLRALERAACPRSNEIPYNYVNVVINDPKT